MSSLMPTGQPAASDTAGQQPNSDPQTTQTMNDTASLAQGQPAASQSDTGASTDVANPAAQRAAQEAARYRTELREAQKIIAEYKAAAQAAEEAQLSELEKAQRRIAEYQTQEAQWLMERQQMRIQQAVQTHAARLGIIDLDAAARLLDMSALEFSEDGVPTNTEALLAQMLEQRPWLRGSQSAASAAPVAPPPPPSAGMPASPARSTTQSGNGLTRAIIEQMGPREYAARRDEVQEWLRTHPNG